ncbi:hypothetical protein PR048_020252 [Dryococelus australis]|uniref:Uncharacterized protein n=1 Tax=Dryococelus australis TaxID=614101 RepID=A0ABQ9H5S4_9NEOP|nr:hypothetical protein PR048_020252 [Dryococelus australis]
MLSLTRRFVASLHGFMAWRASGTTGQLLVVPRSLSLRWRADGERERQGAHPCQARWLAGWAAAATGRAPPGAPGPCAPAWLSPWAGRATPSPPPRALLEQHHHSTHHPIATCNQDCEASLAFWGGGDKIDKGGLGAPTVRLLASQRICFNPRPVYSRIFACGKMPLVGGFSRGFHVSPTLSFRCCSILALFHPHRLSRSKSLNSTQYNFLLWLPGRNIAKGTRRFHCRCNKKNIVSAADKVIHEWSSAEMQEWGKREIPKKTRRPAALSGTIPTCDNPAVIWPRLNPVRLGGRRAVASHGWLELTAAVSHTLRTVLDFSYTSCTRMISSLAHQGRRICTTTILSGRSDILREFIASYLGYNFVKRRTLVHNGQVNKGPPLLASHQDEPGSIPGWVNPGFSHVGIVPGDAVGQRVFLDISGIPHPFIPALLHTSITLIDSQDPTVKSRPNLFTHSKSKPLVVVYTIGRKSVKCWYTTQPACTFYGSEASISSTARSSQTEKVAQRRRNDEVIGHGPAFVWSDYGKPFKTEIRMARDQ